MNDPERNRKTLAIFEQIEEDLPPMRAKDCMKTIARRIEHLRKTIQDQSASPGALGFYRAEYQALRWAYGELKTMRAAKRAARASADAPMREAA